MPKWKKLYYNVENQSNFKSFLLQRLVSAFCPLTRPSPSVASKHFDLKFVLFCFYLADIRSTNSCLKFISSIILGTTPKDTGDNKPITATKKDNFVILNRTAFIILVVFLIALALVGYVAMAAALAAKNKESKVAKDSNFESESSRFPWTAQDFGTKFVFTIKNILLDLACQNFISQNDMLVSSVCMSYIYIYAKLF